MKYKIPIIIFFLAFAGYLANLPIDYSKTIKTRTFRRLLTSYDVTSATFLPYEIIKNKTLHFSEETLRGMDGAEEATVHSVIKINDKYYSSYPILTGTLAVPIYLIPILLNKVPALQWVEDLAKILVLGRISASFFTSLSVVLFYLILLEINKLKRLKTTKWVYIYLLFYAFGTNLYSVASRSLWQHTSSLLIISLIVLFLLKSLFDDRYIKWLGALSALSYMARPINLVLVFVVTIYAFLKHRDKFISYLLYAFPFLVLQLLYNTYIWGNPLTTEYIVKNNTSFSTPILKGLVGNLFSPARSFLFISPPLVLSYYGMSEAFLKEERDGLNCLLKTLALTFFAIFIIYSKWWC